jgi:FlaG/FlaF family flagellin (archaellin)
MMKNFKNSDAVSPVIGVMLMIVVTVVIAAVVSAFASDMSGGQDTAPVASIQCKIVKEDTNNAVLTFKHISGDSINTANLRIIVSYTDSGGAPVQKRTTGTPVSGLTDSKGDSVSANVPYLTDVKAGDVGDVATNFSSFMWTTGEILSSGNAAGFQAIIGVSPSDISIGDTFNIKLVDTSSQKAIVDQDVTVQ